MMLAPVVNAGMMINMKFIFVLLLLISTECFAENKWYLAVGGWSYHTSARDYKFDGKRTRNEVHHPFGIEYEVDQKDYTLSLEWITFVNSHYQQSNAINLSYFQKTGYGNFGFKLGVVTGYEKKTYNLAEGHKTVINSGGSEYIFVPLPTYSIKFRSLKFDLSFAPRSDQDPTSSNTFIFLLKIKI